MASVRVCRLWGDSWNKLPVALSLSFYLTYETLKALEKSIPVDLQVLAARFSVYMVHNLEVSSAFCLCMENDKQMTEV